MKKILLVVLGISFSALAMPGQPSMNEPVWNYPSADLSLTANTKFITATRHTIKHMSLADVIKKNSKEFNTNYVITPKVLKQFAKYQLNY